MRVQLNLSKAATQIDNTKILRTNGSLMKEESIAVYKGEHSAIHLSCNKQVSLLINNF